MTTYNTARPPQSVGSCASPSICKCGIAAVDCEYHKPEPKPPARSGTVTVSGVDYAYTPVQGLSAWRQAGGTTGPLFSVNRDTPAERLDKLQRLLDCGAIDKEQFKEWFDNPPDDSGAFLREPAADVYFIHVHDYIEL